LVLLRSCLKDIAILKEVGRTWLVTSSCFARM